MIPPPAVPTRELVAALDDLLGASAFPDGQHNGLQVEGRPEVARVATAVSVSRATIDAALDWGADCLLTHHGLLWSNQPLHVQGVRRDRLRALLQADLNLVAYHLPLDAHPTLGNNAALADAAGCTEVEPAFAYRGPTVGVVGRLPEPRPFGAWVRELEAALRDGCPVGTGPFQVWPFGPDEVERVGFVSGAAPHQVQDAIDLGLDAFVTGEATEGVYHLAREAGIHFVAGGHYLTERGGVQRLGAWVARRFGVETQFLDVETRA